MPYTYYKGVPREIFPSVFIKKINVLFVIIVSTCFSKHRCRKKVLQINLNGHTLNAVDSQFATILLVS